MKYHQITQEERYQIYALKKEGLSQTVIAKNLSKHRGQVNVIVLTASFYNPINR